MPAAALVGAAMDVHNRELADKELSEPCRHFFVGTLLETFQIIEQGGMLFNYAPILELLPIKSLRCVCGVVCVRGGLHSEESRFSSFSESREAR